MNWRQSTRNYYVSGLYAIERLPERPRHSRLVVTHKGRETCSFRTLRDAKAFATMHRNTIAARLAS